MLDLEKLEKQLDEVLAKETKESLTEWLTSVRMDVHATTMNAKEFIAKELENFIEQFPQVRVRYELRKLSGAHFVEIVPREVHDEKYISWEAEMLDKFVELYPEEVICFMSDGALVGIENAEFTLQGVSYARSESKAQAMEYA
jgi:hypothetical protein